MRMSRWCTASARACPANIETWRKHGYTIHVMTGVAWGQYQDYLNGQFDGQNHWDQAQTQADGKPILHGGNRDIPYISPGENYGKYLTLGVKRALDAGAQAIHLEEPEFWARGGWEENFKREWTAYYHEDWQPPNSSPDAQYRASKLKYFLYRRALSQIFDFVKEYGKANNRDSPLLRPDALPDQLRALEDRQPGILVDRCGRRRLHRTGLDRHGPHCQPSTRAAARSARSKPRFWNTAPCRTWCALPAGASGI